MGTSRWKGLSARVFGLCAAVICMIAMGCGTKTASKPQQESHLKPLVLMFGQYTGQHRGQPPADDASFKQFVKSNANFLSSFNVDTESVFISERDGKPYVIVYGSRKGPAALAGAPVVAYEQEGVGGRRYVASSLGAVQEVDEARLRELVPNGT